MSDFTQTPNLNLYKPTYNADAEQWGNHLNANADKLDAVISSIPGGSTGGFLPTAGGTMTGPLNYATTGAGGLQRSAQDRSADIANVLDFGADPTGVADSAPAINAAAATLAPGPFSRHKAVYLPAGVYHVRSQINLTACQCLFGDSRGSSVITVSDDFDPAAAAVIYVTAANFDPGPVLRDFGITFTQPSDQGSRANFKTLAAGGTSHLGGTGVQYPWAIAAGTGSTRIQIIRVRIGGAWNGITTNGFGALYYIDNVEMGAFNIGISYGRGVPVLDFTQFVGYHFWAYDMPGSLANVFMDGQSIALYIGNGTINLIGPTIFWGRVIFDDDTGRGDGTMHISGAMLDGAGCGIEVMGIGLNHLFVSNIYGSAGTNRARPFININGPAHVRISNLYSHSSSSYPEVLVQNPGADVSITNFHNLFFTPDTNWAQVVTGKLRLTNGYVYATGVRTAAVIAETSNGTLSVDNVQLDAQVGNSSVAVSMVTASAISMLGRIAFGLGTWTFSLPGALRTSAYSPQTRFVGSLFADGIVQAGLPGGGVVSFGLVSAAGAQKSVTYYRGNIVAWALQSSGAADDFAITRWNDTGTYVGTPFSINRATGTISLAALQASTTYANDAAAATGGVPVSGLYRNGSVVQVRVT